jgi:Fe-S cluster assembly scaffold protein SufB
MAHRIIQNDHDLAELFQLLSNLKLPITVEWVQGRDRTRDQNALQWLWATEAANQLGDRTPAEMQQEWKLRFGVPILREDSADFRATYDRTIKPLAYEQKVEAMAFIDVTSAMKVRQMVRYLDTVQRECAEQGVRLTDPDPELAKYQARYGAAGAA